MKKTLAVTVTAMLFASCGQPEKEPSAGLRELKATLERCAGQDLIMFGHQDDLAYGHSWREEEGRSDVKEVCGDYPAVAGWDIGRIEHAGAEKNLDNVDFDMMRRRIQEHHRGGGINTISWHADNPATGGDSWDNTPGAVAAALPGGAKHAEFKKWLDRTADFLLSLRDDGGELIPIIWRPWHEHTGHWFWWGKEQCSRSEYAELWKMTHRYLSGRGLNNLLWAYSPGGGVDAEEYMERFPGTGYVDMLGFDIYQTGGGEEATETYRAGLREMLGIVTGLGKRYGLPVAVTETGVESVPVADWWTEVLYKTVEPYPVTYVLVWRNASDRPEHYYGPFPGQLSEADFVKFHELPRTVFRAELAGMNRTAAQ